MNYTFPILSLTGDGDWNRMIADLLVAKYEKDEKMKMNWFEDLRNDLYDKQVLTMIYGITRLMNDDLVSIFQGKLGALREPLMNMDIYRLREKTKRILSIWLGISKDLLGLFTDDKFYEKTKDRSLWDTHPSFSELPNADQPQTWNSLLLMRFTDIHSFLVDLLSAAEFQTLTLQGREGTEHHNGLLGSDSIKIVREKYLVFQKELSDYLKLVSRLK